MLRIHAADRARNNWTPTDPAKNLRPMSDIDLMIKNGWGTTDPRFIPDDWRTRTKPKYTRPSRRKPK